MKNNIANRATGITAYFDKADGFIHIDDQDGNELDKINHKAGPKKLMQWTAVLCKAAGIEYAELETEADGDNYMRSKAKSIVKNLTFIPASGNLILIKGE